MNAIEYIKREAASVRRSTDRVMNDVTDELFNWAPPGTANTISATFVHFVNAEDSFIQKVLQGKLTVWETGGWAEKTGIPKTPDKGEDWSEFKHRKVNIQPIQEYKVAVWAATETYLATLDEDELDRMVQFAGSERTVGEMLMLSASQSHSHLGEIAALKGIQGAKGLPV